MVRPTKMQVTTPTKMRMLVPVATLPTRKRRGRRIKRSQRRRQREVRRKSKPETITAVSLRQQQRLPMNLIKISHH
jgi:hypothetical protein